MTRRYAAEHHGICFRALSVSLLLLSAATSPAAAAAATAPAAQPAAPSAPAPDYSGLPPKVQQFMRDADSALKTGNANLALIQLKNAVQLAPNEGVPRARLGSLLVRGRDPVAGERELRQAQKDKAPVGLVVPGIVSAMLMRGEMQQLLAEFPDPPGSDYALVAPEILTGRAYALQSLGRTAEATTTIDEALKLRRDASILLAGAMIANQQNNTALARRFTDEMLKTNPANTDAHSLSIDLYRQTGQLQKALAEATQFAKSSPRNVNAAIFRIQVLLDLNQVAEARRDMDALLKRAPRSPTANFYLAVVMLHENNAKGAWAQLLRFRNPGYFQSEPALAMQVAQIGIASGNTEAGAAILTTFVAHNPDVLPARLELAGLRLSQNDPRAAVDLLIPVKDSNNLQVQLILTQAYLQMNRYTDATALLQKEIASPAAANNDLLKQQLALSAGAIGNTGESIELLQQLEKNNPGNPAINGQLSMAYLRSGKPDEALAVADRMAKAQPKSAFPPFYRGIVFSTQGKLADAATEFAHAIADDPKFVPALFYRSDIELAQGNPDAAKADLDKILVAEPASFAAYGRLAQIALNEGRDDQVLPLLTKAVNVAPNAPAPRLTLANYQLSLRKYQDALATVDALLRSAPNNADALALRGRIQMAMGDTQASVTSFRALAVATPNNPAAQVLLANALRAAKDSAGAEAAIRRAIQLAPGATQLRQTLIGFQLADGKTDAALASVRAYASAYPGTAADLLQADTLMHLNRVQDAIAGLAKAYTQKPDSGLAVALVAAEVGAGESKQALDVLSGWVRKNPADLNMRVQYATLLMETGDQNAARSQFEGLLKQRPNDPVVLNNLGWLLQKDDPAQALSLVTQAAKIAPRNPQIADTLGWMKFGRKDAQGALVLLKRAHDLKSDDAEIGYHLAVALDATGKRAEAKTLLKSVLARNTKFADAATAQTLVARW